MNLKKILLFTLIVSFLLPIFPLEIFANETAQTKNFVHVRASANIASSIVTSLNGGVSIEIIGKEMSWYKIKTGNTVGFVSEDLVKNIDSETFAKYNPVKSNYTLLSEYTTKFGTGDVDRNHNIELSAYKNSIIVPPKTIFSFNKNTGNSSNPANGWRSADIIVNKKREKGIGGGICQTSSTTHSVVKQVSGLKITERRPHSVPVGYVPIVNEAMVSYGYSDFKFRNDNSYSIFVGAKVNHVKGSLTMSIYKIGPEKPVEPVEPVKPVVVDYNPAAKARYIEYLKHLNKNPHSIKETLTIAQEGILDSVYNFNYAIDDVDKDGIIDLIVEANIHYLTTDGEKIIGTTFICQYVDANFKLTALYNTLNTVGDEIGRFGYFENNSTKEKSWYFIDLISNTASKLELTMKLGEAEDFWGFDIRNKQLPTNFQNLLSDSIIEYENNKAIKPGLVPVVSVNGQIIKYNLPPQNIDNRVYIEMRSLFENLGYEVEYDEATKATVIYSEKESFILEKGFESTEMLKVTGEENIVIPIAIPLKIVQNRTFFPLRFAGELIGYTVSWNQDSYTASLNKIIPAATPTVIEDIATSDEMDIENTFDIDEIN